MVINFISCKNSSEIGTMHSKIGNTDETIQEFFESLLQKYLKNLEESVRSIDLLH